jgi:UPF0148 protein
MPARKEDEIMAEYLLKGGKMLEKTCKTCGCPLFEVKGKTFCVVCAEDTTAVKTAKTTTVSDEAAPLDRTAARVHDEGCTRNDGGMLAEDLAMTIHTLCERVRNGKDPGDVLVLMNAVKTGTEALEILYRL